jgi:molybdate transport system substrate-binding protein
MAIRHLLAALAREHEDAGGAPTTFESVGGVDAARRVASGEPVDLVALASGALADLAARGHVRAATLRPFAVSRAALAVRSGAPQPSIASREALLATLRDAASIAYSTGPSGDALLALLDAAGILAEMRSRLVQAPPGVPVASFVSAGTAQLGIQQLSELAGAPGIEVVGVLPPEAGIATTFAIAVAERAGEPDAAQAFIEFIVSARAHAGIRRARMAPVCD